LNPQARSPLINYIFCIYYITVSMLTLNIINMHKNIVKPEYLEKLENTGFKLIGDFTDSWDTAWEFVDELREDGFYASPYKTNLSNGIIIAFKSNVTKQYEIIKNNNGGHLYRHCPTCNDFVAYRTVSAYLASIRYDRGCMDCYKESRTGVKNHFYGKTHSKETCNVISKKNKGKHHSVGTEFKKGQEAKNRKPIYECWLANFGKEEADKRWKVFIEKQSFNNSGEKNSMYGKPSPQGSGNGWCGWYKGWFFRSLLELSYMINEIEAKGLHWESGEQHKYKIPYTDLNGDKRNYFPDFIIDNKFVVECKPISLQTSESVKAKIKGAKKFCKKRKFEYVLLEPHKLTIEEIKELYLTNNIKFMDRYDKKFKEKYLCQ